MACLFGHKWNGCKCDKCGKIRNEQHIMDLCTGNCKRCRTKIQNEQHDWNGCKCKKCYRTRDEQHDWQGSVCALCGKQITNEEVENLTDQKQLIEIANSSNDLFVRISAVGRLSNQQDLAYIAKTNNVDPVCAEAVVKISNQQILEDIAINAPCPTARGEAVQKLSNQIALSCIVKNDKDAWVRRCAVENKHLKEQSIIADVAQSDDNFSVRREALYKLEDQSILFDIAVNEKNEENIDIAFSRITDPFFRKEVLGKYCELNKHIWILINFAEQYGDTHNQYQAHQCLLCKTEKDKKYVGSFKD